MTDFITGTHKADLHGNYHHAIAQLSSTVNSKGIRQLFADMHGELVQLRRLDSNEKRRKFAVTAAEADAFVEAWTQFKADVAAWELAERDRLRQEEMAETARLMKVWREIEKLYDTVPGLEIVARESEEVNWETGPRIVTVYDVKLASTNHHHTGYYSVDRVLEDVQEAIRGYITVLEIAENDEKMGFPANSTRMRDDIIALRKTFLAQHRIFLAKQTGILVLGHDETPIGAAVQAG